MVKQMMNTTATQDEISNTDTNNPGQQLAVLRQQQGYTIDYVASKLHLRVRIIELIEAGDFNLLPEAVFVKGYLRAYAKLLDISPDPFLTSYNAKFVLEGKVDRATLWQSKRETHKAEHLIRWVTLFFALGVLIAVGVWWQKNRDNQSLYPTKEIETDLSLNQSTTELKLTDLSKMQSIITPKTEMTPLEKFSG